MKRIIDGKAYNTETAQAVARNGDGKEIGSYTKKVRVGRFGSRLEDVPYGESVTLYRTKDGAFFFVTVRTDFIGQRRTERKIVEFEPTTYDEACTYVLSGDAELLAEGIFPTREWLTSYVAEHHAAA